MTNSSRITPGIDEDKNEHLSQSISLSPILFVKDLLYRSQMLCFTSSSTIRARNLLFLLGKRIIRSILQSRL